MASSLAFDVPQLERDLADIMVSSTTHKKFAPATLRNREPILTVLRSVLPDHGRVLEIAAGTGEHAVYFAAALPKILWQPTDIDGASLLSIDAWVAEQNVSNVKPALHLDVNYWPESDDFAEVFEAVVCINMIHITPWHACRGLMQGAARALRERGHLLLYGPFKVDGEHTAESNAVFDEHLKRSDPAFGVRDIAAVADEALRYGLKLERTHDMPANNLTAVFRKRL